LKNKKLDAEIQRKRQKMLELQALGYSEIGEFIEEDVKETIANFSLSDKDKVWTPVYTTEYINEMSKKKLEELIKNMETTNNEREDRMKFKDEINWDYYGSIKRIDGQFFLRLGCKYHICKDLREVAQRIRAALEKEYSEKKK